LIIVRVSVANEEQLRLFGSSEDNNCLHSHPPNQQWMFFVTNFPSCVYRRGHYAGNSGRNRGTRGRQ
jgi:hypothetical protein